MSHNTWEGFSHYGSGTTPFIEDRTDDGYPAITTRDPANYRQGPYNIIINFEDLSAHRGGSTKRVSVSTSVTRLDSSLNNRRAISITNEDSNLSVFLGFSNAITTDVSNTAGYALLPQTSINIDLKNLLGIWARTSSGSATVSVMELA